MGFQNIDNRIEKRFFKENKTKHALKLYSELERIWKAKYNLGFIQLEKPIFKGYKKFFVLREDFANRKDVKIFKEILPHVQHIIHCRDRLFLHKDRETGKKVPIPHSINSLSKKIFDKLSEGCKKYFYPSLHVYYGHKEIRHVFTLPYAFVPKIDKHFLTKLPVIDSKLNSMEAKINKQLHSHKGELWKLLIKIKGWGNGKDYDWDIRPELKYDLNIYFKE